MRCTAWSVWVVGRGDCESLYKQLESWDERGPTASFCRVSKNLDVRQKQSVSLDSIA